MINSIILFQLKILKAGRRGINRCPAELSIAETEEKLGANVY